MVSISFFDNAKTLAGAVYVLNPHPFLPKRLVLPLLFLSQLPVARFFVWHLAPSMYVSQADIS